MGCEVDPSAPPACLVGVELQALVLEIREVGRLAGSVANHCREDAPDQLRGRLPIPHLWPVVTCLFLTVWVYKTSSVARQVQSR